METGTDQSAMLAERIRSASAAGHRLAIAGGGSQRALAFPAGFEPDVRPLEASGHQGIVNLAPSELVVTVRAGTPVMELQAALEEVGMMLPFEPAMPTPSSTVGGMVALGLSGARRPWTASLRDAVLGTRIVNGRGEILRFGGEVMKNVAGFDVSRLMAGSLGSLGLLLEISFKLLPAPAYQAWLRREATATAFIEQARDWGRTALPFSGLAWADGVSHIRLGGGQEAVQEAAERLGAEADIDGPAFWSQLRDRHMPFLTRTTSGDERLWRLSLPPATPPLDLPGEWLLNWGGGERWLRSTARPEAVRAAVEDAGGHARLWFGDPAGASWLHPRPAAHARLEGEVRAALDPDGVFFAPLIAPHPRTAQPTRNPS
ncbi:MULTISPECIES: glycolate oxidase subunit GlcE [unclassified Thioalkalivibrio]|uniref:glycolate oxidase subunit GlcE n=1 Tax=unclassified Thioalkalivibrio TaxID=2621013 RepID=UPI000374AB72|nr:MULTISPECIES: glycolate oxidase subunit GlcE [unclassified Thioalkalivibrio]